MQTERNKSLIRSLVRDLISDYRVTIRRIQDGTAVAYGHNLLDEYDYANKCKERAAEIYANRHAAQLDRFGMYRD
jgi:hypothetical protein